VHCALVFPACFGISHSALAFLAKASSSHLKEKILRRKVTVRRCAPAFVFSFFRLRTLFVRQFSILITMTQVGLWVSLSAVVAKVKVVDTSDIDDVAALVGQSFQAKVSPALIQAVFEDGVPLSRSSSVAEVLHSGYGKTDKIPIAFRIAGLRLRALGSDSSPPKKSTREKPEKGALVESEADNLD